jgi:hypothetical protein
MRPPALLFALVPLFAGACPNDLRVGRVGDAAEALDTEPLSGDGPSSDGPSSDGPVEPVDVGAEPMSAPAGPCADARADGGDAQDSLPGEDAAELPSGCPLDAGTGT